MTAARPVPGRRTATVPATVRRPKALRGSLARRDVHNLGEASRALGGSSVAQLANDSSPARPVATRSKMRTTRCNALPHSPTCCNSRTSAMECATLQRRPTECNQIASHAHARHGIRTRNSTLGKLDCVAASSDHGLKVGVAVDGVAVDGVTARHTRTVTVSFPAARTRACGAGAADRMDRRHSSVCMETCCAHIGNSLPPT